MNHVARYEVCFAAFARFFKWFPGFEYGMLSASLLACERALVCAIIAGCRGHLVRFCELLMNVVNE
jgi:hypothetical protein